MKNENNIIRIKDDISDAKTISIKQASDILGLDYHTTRRRIYSSGEIGYFNYDGKIVVVEEDVREYKRKHYKKPVKE